MSICNNAPEYRHPIHPVRQCERNKNTRSRVRLLQMRIYYLCAVRQCECIKYMRADFWPFYGTISTWLCVSFSHSYRTNRPLKKRPREEKLNWIPSIFTDIRAYTHRTVLQPKACKICYKWYISSAERGFVSVFNVGTVFFVYFFFSSVFSPLIFSSLLGVIVWIFAFRTIESLSVCANLLTLSLALRFWTANEPEPYVIYLLFIIKHLIIRIRTIRFTSIVAENNKSPLLVGVVPLFILCCAVRFPFP